MHRYCIFIHIVYSFTKLTYTVSIHPSIYSTLYPSDSIYIPIHPSNYQHTHTSILLCVTSHPSSLLLSIISIHTVYSFTHLPTPPTHPSFHPSIHPHIHPHLFIQVYPFIHSPISLSNIICPQTFSTFHLFINSLFSQLSRYNGCVCIIRCTC